MADELQLTVCFESLAAGRGVIHNKAVKIKALLAALIALLVSATPAFAQSSSEDRQHVVTIVRHLERAPLDSSARGERAWAIQWLTDVPDISVVVCSDPLGSLIQEKYAYRGEITVQYMLGMAAFIIENPAKASDVDAQQLAGVESALKAYQGFRTAKPGEQSPALDKLLELQSGGGLPDFVRAAYRQCQSKSGK